MSERDLRTSQMGVAVYVDGGCLRNGSTSARGYGSVAVINADGGSRLFRFGLNATTNNAAEYLALIRAARICKDLGLSDVEFLMDSLLVVNQIAGRWECRDGRMGALCHSARDILRLCGGKVSWVPREQIVARLGH